MVITHADLIAARNPVSHLVLAPDRPGQPSKPVPPRQCGWVCGSGSPPGDEPYANDNDDDAVRWLTDLRDRLGELMPDLPGP